VSRQLPPIEYAGRIDDLRARLDDRGLPGMVVTDLTNLRWLTGFTGSSGTVAVTPDRAILVTDGRYRERAIDELGAAGVPCEVVAGFTRSEQHDLLVAAVTGLDRLGAESNALTHARWTALAVDLPIEPADGLIEEGRRRKDRGEVARIAAAARCADLALAEVAPRLGEGLTEADVRTELEYRMRRHGADGPSYDTIVASGTVHAARPHHHASRRTIVDGDTVVIDVGALVDGYHSDMTRSYVLGEPTAEQRDRYDLLLGVQLAGLDAVRAGVPAKDVDAVCRTLIAEAGYADWFLHSTGHGVGLRIHEDPFQGPTSSSTLVAGDVVTVEPGLYRVGFGGFRIEDLVEVVDDGCRILTSSPKDTPCLPSPPTT
jgi:Xaa-Pro aminopeptidase